MKILKMEAIKKEPQVWQENSFQDVKKFAEILYKCKLCTSLPSILTSEDSFLAHVNNTHYQDSDALKKCRNCQLKFRTKEDLWAHRKLMHSDFASEDVDSSEENDQFEIAWQVTTDHVEVNGTDMPKRKKNKREKQSRRQKKPKVSEEPEEEDPHVVIAHGVEHAVSPSSPNDSASLLKLTNQIASDASPTGNAQGNGNLTASSTPEFGKYTKLIREGGNIVYFCQVCNWKSQMRIMFTEHCKSTAHLVKVTVAEQNDNGKVDENSAESSTVQKYGKRGHFMSFLDEKINFYINKRLSNESINSEGAIHQNYPASGTGDDSGGCLNDSSTNEDSVNLIKIKKEPEEVPNVTVVPEKERNININMVHTSNDSKDLLQSINRRKRKASTRVMNREQEDDFSSDDSDITQKPTVNKVSRQFVNLPKMSEKMDVDSDFKIEASMSHFSPLRSDSVEKESQHSKNEEQERDENGVKDIRKLKVEENTSDDVKDDIKRVETVKSGVTDSNPFETELHHGGLYTFRCSLCMFVCNDITEYKVHFEAEHEPEQITETSTESGFADCKTEQWKVQRIKELLPDILIAHPRGNVSRDLLLQKASTMASEPEIALWGPACNKALRELFPDSLAQRKGKFKKTYFFGVALIDQVQQEHEVAQTSTEGNESVDFSPLRDMTQDMDKILQHLHTIVRWKGDMEAGVSRDDVLHILGRKLEDPEVQHWGVQCNRAIRILFPNVQMKRKGKYKTTVYFGVTFSNLVTKEDFASLTSQKSRTQKPAIKDDGIKPKLTWRDAIRTIGGKAFTTGEFRKTVITRGWGPLMHPGSSGSPDLKGASPSPTMYMQDVSNAAIIPPNVTADMLNSTPPVVNTNDLPMNNSPQNMSLLRYHLTSDEFNMYYKFGADLAKTVWQSKEQQMSSKEMETGKSEETIENREMIKCEIGDSTADEKSNDADDENSQSTVGDDRSTSSPFLTQKTGNHVIETEQGIMYIKQEVESDQES